MLLYVSILVSAFIVLISFRMFQRSFGTMNVTRYMPFMHLFYFQILVMTIIGAEFLYAGIYGQALKDFGTTRESIRTALFVVWYATLLLAVCLYLFLRNTHEQTRIFWNTGLIKSDTHTDREFLFVCTLVSVFCVVYFCMYDAPIFQLLKGTLGRTLIARVGYVRNFEGSYLIKNVLGESVSVLVAYITYLYYLANKTMYWRVLALVNFFCGIFIAGANLSKSGIVVFLIPYIFLMVCNGRKLPIRKLMFFGALGVGVLIVMYSVQRRDSGGWRILFNFHEGPIGRILYMQIQSLPVYFMVFPAMHPYTWGKGIALLRFFNLPHIEAGRVVATFLEPEGVAAGWVGTANTLYMGDAYANFGWVGVLLSPVLVAFWYAFFYKKLIYDEKTPFNTAVNITVLYSLTNAYTGGFCSGYIVNTRIIAILLLAGCFSIYKNVRQRNYNVGIRVWR